LRRSIDDPVVKVELDLAVWCNTAVRGSQASFYRLRAAGFRVSGGLTMTSKTIKVDYLARVEGEAALQVKMRGDRVEDVKFKVFEPRACSRRSCAPPFPRGARHHRTHLRHLPHRLQMSARSTPWSRPWAHRRPGGSAPGAASSTAGEWIESPPCTSNAPRPRFPGLSGCHRDARDHCPRSSRPCALRRSAII